MGDHNDKYPFTEYDNYWDKLEKADDESESSLNQTLEDQESRDMVRIDRENKRKYQKFPRMRKKVRLSFFRTKRFRIDRGNSHYSKDNSNFWVSFGIYAYLILFGGLTVYLGHIEKFILMKITLGVGFGLLIVGAVVLIIIRKRNGIFLD